MNVLKAIHQGSALVHDTEVAELSTTQNKYKPACGNRKIYGYVLAEGAEKVTCPRCLSNR